MKTKGVKHENYEILNLLGYGLAKFDQRFVAEFNKRSKEEFYASLVELGVAETTGTIKNRQDLFDPFFDNGRKGWHQKGDAYIHRKHLIDSLFGDLDCREFAGIVEMYLSNQFGGVMETAELSPIMKSRFKQLQKTGLEAEIYFKESFQRIIEFSGGLLEDARLYGDGYDFQVTVNSNTYLAEVKGVRGEEGAIRLTQKEFLCAREYRNEYAVVVVSNLDSAPKLTPIFDPVSKIQLFERTIEKSQTYFSSSVLRW